MEKLIGLALSVRENAYAPYSGFRVGAALQATDGSIYTGVNVESASYGGTICAERNCLTSAVAEGKRTFTALAVASDSEEFTVPCGICLQVLSEFGDMDVYCVDCRGNYEIYRLSQLLPHGFRLDQSK